MSMAVKAEEKPDGAPEWMVSFADMITIMMSFFVIMFAIASGEVAKGKRNKPQEAAINSLQQRFGPKYQPFASWGLMPGNSPVKAGGHDKSKTPTALPSDEGGDVKVLKKERARIRIPGQGDRVVIGGVVFFDDTGGGLNQQQKERLKVIAAEIAGKPQEIEILGHASNCPLPKSSSYHDRWDLAYARCRQTVAALAALKIDPERMRIGVNRASTAPAEGSTPGADEQIDIFLTDALPEKYTAK